MRLKTMLLKISAICITLADISQITPNFRIEKKTYYEGELPKFENTEQNIFTN